MNDVVIAHLGIIRSPRADDRNSRKDVSRESRLREGRQRFRSSAGKLAGITSSQGGETLPSSTSDASTAQQVSVASRMKMPRRKYSEITDVSDATSLVSSRSFRLSEDTIFPDEQLDQVDELLSDAIGREGQGGMTFDQKMLALMTRIDFEPSNSYRTAIEELRTLRRAALSGTEVEEPAQSEELVNLCVRDQNLRRAEVKRLSELLQLLSNHTRVDNHAVSLSSENSSVFNIPSGCCVDAFSISSMVVNSATSSPSFLAGPARVHKIGHQSSSKPMSNAYVAKSDVDVFPGCSGFASANHQASTWNTYAASCLSPRVSLDGSHRALRKSPSHHVQIEMQLPSSSSGYDRIINRMRRASSRERVSNASRIVNTDFVACGTSRPTRRSTTASPVRHRSATASPARQQVMSPSVQTRAPTSIAKQPLVATPRLVSASPLQACSPWSTGIFAVA